MDFKWVLFFQDDTRASQGVQTFKATKMAKILKASDKDWDHCYLNYN